MHVNITFLKKHVFEQNIVITFNTKFIFFYLKYIYGKLYVKL
jgi:hypothetical protein